MTSDEHPLREQITELNEKITIIEHEILQLQKRRKAYTAKMQLMENHLNPDDYHVKGDAERTDSSDESFSTTELLELDLSSISSSVLGSEASLHSNPADPNDFESDDIVEDGKRSRFVHKRDYKIDKKDE